jgi:hypothetical protein
LKLSLTALNQAAPNITPDQKSLLGAAFLSSLDAFSVTLSPPSPDSASWVVYHSTRHLQKLCALLKVFSETTPPASDTLSTTLTSLARTCLSFLDFTDVSVTRLAWNALAILLKIDFDVVLSLMNYLNPRLHSATPEFLQTLVTTKFKLRHGVEFVKLWMELLRNQEMETSPLAHPDFTALYIAFQ